MSWQWSPGDLSRQGLVVSQTVARAEDNRRRLAAARREVAERLRAIAVPLAVSASLIAAAFAVGRYAGASTARRQRPRSERAPSAPQRVQGLLALAMSLAQIYLRVRSLVAPRAEPTTPTHLH
ncbi:MAG TPA: hypothetical protein VFO94_13085 [Gammaproteobacteria bacterium]|nr:hypothetical protein [Gammaproteobacteria bacterium]